MVALGSDVGFTQSIWLKSPKANTGIPPKFFSRPVGCFNLVSSTANTVGVIHQYLINNQKNLSFLHVVWVNPKLFLKLSHFFLFQLR
eukprot:5099976-Ditylum_brightwellii.AAC.1